MGDNLSYSSFDFTEVRLIKFPEITFFLDWCLDYAPMKCEMWKADGQCQLSDRRVQGMIRKLCMETCNYCGELLPSFSLSVMIYQVWILSDLNQQFRLFCNLLLPYLLRFNLD